MLVSLIAETVNCLKLVGNPLQDISGVVPLPQSNDDPTLIFWCADKNMERLPLIKTGTVICSTAVPDTLFAPGCNYIIVDNPRLAFQTVLSSFFVEDDTLDGVADSARIHPSAQLAPGVVIGEGVVIEKAVLIGANSCIGHNTVIKRGTVIGRDVVIGANCTIGGFGFGFEKNRSGSYERIPHLGNVIIEDNVEVCNNTVIDRAMLGSTLIRKNAKIHSLVQISHGAEIGENSLIITNAMVAGSVRIGKNVWVAPSVSIMNHKVVGDDAVLGLGAVVIKDVSSGEVVAGNPARVLPRKN